MNRFTSLLLKNKTASQTVIKNALWLLSGQTIGRLIRALLIIYAARLLGAGSFGAFSYALSIAAFLSIFADLGINAFTTRELARQQTKDNQLVTAGLYLKIVIVLGLLILIPFLAPYLTNIEEAKGLIVIAVLVFAFDTIRDFGSAISRAMEKMEIESTVNVLTNLAIALAGGSALYFYSTSTALAWGYALGAGLGALFMLFAIRQQLSSLWFKVPFSKLKQVLAFSLPFSVMAIMGVIMINTDIIMLGWLTDATQTGLYAAAQKPIQLLYLLPSIIAASLFPLLTRTASDISGRFRLIFEKGITASLMIALPISIGGWFLGEEIISFLYGAEYLSSALSFSLLALTLWLVFPSIIAGNAIFALNAQKKLIVFSLLGIFGNIILDIILIPTYGITGCALATLINQLILNTYLFTRIKSLFSFSLFSHLPRIIIASLAMAIFIIFISLNIITTIIIAGLIYLFILLILKEPTLLKLKYFLSTK